MSMDRSAAVGKTRNRFIIYSFREEVLFAMISLVLMPVFVINYNNDFHAPGQLKGKSVAHLPNGLPRGKRAKSKVLFEQGLKVLLAAEIFNFHPRELFIFLTPSVIVMA